MNIHINQLEELPHKILRLMADDHADGDDPWYIEVLHGMPHMETKYRGYLVGVEGREILLDRTNEEGERIGVKVLLHEDWIHEVTVP